ncbi:MAG: hypothetical protein ACK47B_23130 [Armatimonadota bacterium]
MQSHLLRRTLQRAPRALLFLALLAASALGVLGGGAAFAEKGITEGVFVDRDGKQHPWTVERSHALTWDGQPYTPAGVVFRSEYLKAPSAETLRKDQEELDRLKAAGVRDLWVDPQRGLLENGNSEIQALIDALESRGFLYGLKVGDRSREPLIGFAPGITPIAIPASQLKPAQQVSWEVRTPRARRSIYVLAEVNPLDKAIHTYDIATGEAVAEAGVTPVRVQLRNSRLVGRSRAQLLVVPEVQVEPEELGSFGDLWSATEGYGEQLKQRLSELKLGPGLRFILDPFDAGDGTLGQEEGVFPTSDEFRAAFQEWLERRSNLHGINIRWRTTDRRIPGVEEAARLVPMWARNDPPDGDGWMLDPAEGVAYRCKPRESAIWDDLDQFRTETLKRWMNRLTVAVKQSGANVPMLFSWSAYHPIFTNSPSPSGYDGLGGNLYGSPADLGPEAAAFALAQAEEADRNTWLIATRLAGPVDDSDRPAPLADAAAVRNAWTSIREAGFRGAYLDPQQVPDAPRLAAELSSALAADTAKLAETPRVCFYPLAISGSERLSRLANGVWWLPSSAPARFLRYGDSIMAYEIVRPLGGDSDIPSATVFWSNSGEQELTFFVDKLTPVELHDTLGNKLKAKTRKETIKFTLGSEPVLVSGIDAGRLFPLELAGAQLEEFDALLRKAETQGIEVKAMRTIYDQSRKQLAPGNAMGTYLSTNQYVERLRQLLQPYIWIEAERPAGHNFSGVTFAGGASSSLVLRVNRPDAPPSGLFKARYVVDISRDASYEIWVAGKAPGESGASPLIWQIDDEPAQEVRSVARAGEEYARGLAWFSLGRLTLKAGRHELLIAIAEKAETGSRRYFGSLDAIVFSREPFRPNGVEKPAIVVARRRSEEKDSEKKRDTEEKGEKSQKSEKGRRKDDTP